MCRGKCTFRDSSRHRGRVSSGVGGMEGKRYGRIMSMG